MPSAIDPEDMVLRHFYAELPSRFAWFAGRWWHDLRLCWYTADKGLWVLVLAIGLVIATFGFTLRAVFAHQDDRRNLTCLARNVYFEARGEPTAGQYAVAEVTMNRKASGRYSDTVCGVVYQKSWDPLRKRCRRLFVDGARCGTRAKGRGMATRLEGGRSGLLSARGAGAGECSALSCDPYQALLGEKQTAARPDRQACLL